MVPRRSFLLSSGAFLSACGGGTPLVLVTEPTRLGAELPIFVATTRSATGQTDVFGAGRSPRVTWTRFDVSVPPDRDPGQIKLASAAPADPTTEFFAVGAVTFDGRDAFRRAVEDAVAQKPLGRREVAVYVHGFNNRFADGLFRKAQITTDFAMPAVGVHYSWSSAGKTSQYLYDRDSAFYARDGLAELLRTLAATGADRIILYAHSMGAQVTVEAVRQLAMAGAPDVFSRMQAVTLLSPDVDLDLFKREVADMPELDLQWFIFVSSNDKALRLSSMIRGGSERLGAITDASEISEINATVIDLSNVKNDDPVGHETVAESPAMIAMFRGYYEHGADMARDELTGHGVVETSTAALGNVTSIVFAQQ